MKVEVKLPRESMERGGGKKRKGGIYSTHDINSFKRQKSQNVLRLRGFFPFPSMP